MLDWADAFGSALHVSVPAAGPARPTVPADAELEFVPPVNIVPPMPSDDAFESPRLVRPVRRRMLENSNRPRPPSIGSFSEAPQSRLIQTESGRVPEIPEPMDGFGPATGPASASANTGITPVGHEFESEPIFEAEPIISEPAPQRPLARPRKRLLPTWKQFWKRD